MDNAPYRSNAIEVASVIQYGLLIVPKVKPHRCQTPGFWRSLLTGHYIRYGSLYRCSFCKEIWVYWGLIGGWTNSSKAPSSASLEAWKRLGGIE